MAAGSHQAVNFWRSLAPAERQAFAAVAEERTFASGVQLMSEGEPTNYVMVILEGWTKITVGQNGGERVVAERGPGQLVGERGALRLNVRSATVVALGQVRALVMRTGEFASFISAHPRALDVVENQIYDRLTEDPKGYGQDGWSGSSPLQLAGHAPQDVQWPQPLAGENCTVLLTDVVGFGARNRSDWDRQIIRREGLGMMQASLGALWEACISEDRGDGLLIVVPPRVTTTKIVECVHRELPGRLRLHNRTYGESARIRLRVAVNVGPVMGDPLGMSGDTIIRTARLVEAPVLKGAMAATGVSLGIIVSTFVYETAIEQVNELLDSDEYRKVEVANKEYRSSAWMRLVDLAPPTAHGDPLRSQRAASDSRSLGLVLSASSARGVTGRPAGQGGSRSAADFPGTLKEDPPYLRHMYGLPMACLGGVPGAPQCAIR